MEKLDRLVWAAGFAFKSFGIRIGVRVTDGQILEELVRYLPPGWKPVSAPFVDRLYSLVAAREPHGSSSRGRRRFNLLYGDIARLARTPVAEEAFELFESDVQLHVAATARHRVFIHAGVVGWQGQAIIVPGRSFTGKSTLVAELVRAGAVYYSDEYAVLDRRGRVHPFARPLALREGAATGRQKRVSLEALRGVAGTRPLTAGLVVVSEYRAGARWRPRALSKGHGLLALLSNTVSARRQPELALNSLQQLAENALILKGTRGEAADTAASLLKMLKQQRAPSKG